MNDSSANLKHPFFPEAGTLSPQNITEIKQILGDQEEADKTLRVMLDLELFTFKTPEKEVFIGFGGSDDIHDHDRWLFYRASEASDWVLNGFASCLRTGLQQEVITAEVAPEPLPLAILSDQLAPMIHGLWRTVSYVRKQRDSFKYLGAEHIILTQRLTSHNNIPLKTLTALQQEIISSKDLHDLACHDGSFKKKFPEYKGIPSSYIMSMLNLDQNLGL